MEAENVPSLIYGFNMLQFATWHGAPSTTGGCVAKIVALRCHTNKASDDEEFTTSGRTHEICRVPLWKKNGIGAPPTLKASGGSRGKMRIAYCSDVPSRKLGQFENDSCNIRSQWQCYSIAALLHFDWGQEGNPQYTAVYKNWEWTSVAATTSLMDKAKEGGHYQGHRADNNKTQIDAVGGITFITICAWADCINSFFNVSVRPTPRFLQKKKNMTCKNDH